MNNRRQLLLALGLSAFAVASLVGYLLWSGYQQEIRTAEITTRNYAAILEARLDAALRRADATLQELAGEIPAAALNKQAESRYARKVQLDLRGHMINFPELAGIRITDASGERLYTSDNPGTPRTQLADRDYFRELRDNPGADLVFSEVVISRAGRRPSVIAARALRDGQGVFRGVVFAVIELEYFQKLFRLLDIGSGGSVSVYRSDTFSEVVRWPLIDDKLNTRLPPDSHTRKLFVQGNKIATVENLSRRDGILRIYSYQLLDRYPFFVAVGFSRQDILAAWRARSLAVGLSGLLLLGLLANLLFRLWRTEASQAQAMAALAKSEGRFRLLFDRASDGIMILSPDGKLMAVNESFARMHGYTTEQMQTLSLKDLDTPDSSRLVRERTKRILSGEILTFEVEHYHKDGHVFPLDVSSSLISTGGVPMIQAFHRDITERRRVEMETARLAAIVENSNDAIISRGIDNKIVSWNVAAEHLFGYSAAEVMGKLVSALIVPPTRMGELDPNRALIAQGQAVLDFETVRHAKDGRLIDVSMNQFPIMSKDGTIVGAAIVFRDITERRRLEDAHLQAQKLESLGTLAGGIAHDFNNILAAIRGNAYLAAEDVGPDHPAAESLEEIRKASVRASELVRRIMAFGRPGDAQHAVVDLSEVADEVLNLLRSTLPAGISLKKEFTRDAPHVLADAGQIHEVIVNLTTNAAYAIGQRAGTIEYRLEPVQVDDKLALSIPGLKPGHYVRLTVSDDGCGMDAATVERIFDAFYTTKPLGEGSGLGLSMVHGIMKSHGGAVTVESRPGAGSAFALYFPAATKHAAKKVDKTTPPPNLLITTRRVLFVDDEEALVSLAKRVISRLGHSISAFTDPGEALAAFRASPQDFDVVVTDLSMPHLSGFAFAGEVLALRPGIPVLLTSGNIREEDARLASEVGIREILPKPVTVDELGRVLDRLFGDALLNAKPPA